MVTIKASVPYPTAPPPPPPDIRSNEHLNPNPADVPPIPHMAHRGPPDMEYHDLGNPWSDEIVQKEEAMSSSQNAGNKKDPSPRGHTLQDVPDILRPGWSGQATPRSSFDSDRSPEREWWDDDEEQDNNNKEDVSNKGKLKQVDGVEQNLKSSTTSQAFPEQLQIKRKPVESSVKDPKSTQPASYDAFASNNPFRKPSITQVQPWEDQLSQQTISKGKGREDAATKTLPDPPIDHFEQLSVMDNKQSSPMFEEKIVVPPLPQQPPPPVPQSQLLYANQLPPIPISPPIDHGLNPWTSENNLRDGPSRQFGPSQTFVTKSTDNLLDRGQHEGRLSLSNELKALPNQANLPPSQPEASLMDEEEPGPPLPRRPVRQESEYFEPPEGPPPPTKPPRPAVVVNVSSDEEFARNLELRNETYAIKHFDWFDKRSGKMRRSSMLTQNKNGPCPLLALVNALILGATEDTQAALDNALRTREQVSLGLIIETLMDELISHSMNAGSQTLPDVDELNRFLMRLRTGMNANPQFVSRSSPAPNLMDEDSPSIQSQPQHPNHQAGSFENTQDIRLYGAFNVKLLHGWLPRVDDEAAGAFRRSAPTYEDAQAIQFGEEELEYKLSRHGLTQQEQQVWEDITSIKHFLRAYPTQLTPYGLDSVRDALFPGEFAILFRNDHFSTIYKHPQDSQLYTLITDAGYADRAEVIWESLVDINGARSEFFSGDFRPVSHDDSVHAIPHSQTAAANPGRSSPYLDVNRSGNVPLSPQEQQEQHDADFAMALQLQEEEEQRHRQEQRQHQQQSQGPGRNSTPPVDQGRRNRGGRRSSGNIPIPLRGNNSSLQEARPLIPPRNAQSRNPGVNRPVDSEAADAPPTYEDAAKESPYVPPLGSPLHPASSADVSAHQSSSNVNLTSNNEQQQTSGVTSGPNQGPSQSRPAPSGGLLHRRRSSAYNENHSMYWGGMSPDYHQNPPGGYYPGNQNPYHGGGQRPQYTTYNDQHGRTSNRNREDRDCIVM